MCVCMCLYTRISYIIIDDSSTINDLPDVLIQITIHCRQ